MVSERGSLSRIGECGPAAAASGFCDAAATCFGASANMGLRRGGVGGECSGSTCWRRVLDGLLPALNVEDIPMGLGGFKVLGGFKIDVGVASPPVSGRCDVRVGLVAGCCRCSNLIRLVI